MRRDELIRRRRLHPRTQLSPEKIRLFLTEFLLRSLRQEISSLALARNFGSMSLTKWQANSMPVIDTEMVTLPLLSPLAGLLTTGSAGGRRDRTRRSCGDGVGIGGARGRGGTAGDELVAIGGAGEALGAEPPRLKTSGTALAGAGSAFFCADPDPAWLCARNMGAIALSGRARIVSPSVLGPDGAGRSQERTVFPRHLDLALAKSPAQFGIAANDSLAVTQP